MQDRREPDPRPEIRSSGGDLLQRRRYVGEQNLKGHLRCRPKEDVQIVRHREHHMVVRHRQHVLHHPLQPPRLIEALALGTVTVAARVGDVFLVAARLADAAMATHRRRPTTSDRANRPLLMVRQRTHRGSVAAEDVSEFESARLRLRTAVQRSMHTRLTVGGGIRDVLNVFLADHPNDRAAAESAEHRPPTGVRCGIQIIDERVVASTHERRR